MTHSQSHTALAWREMADAPENRLVMTKIDDANGVRNEQPMMRRGNLWWIRPGEPNEMYVYYRPTHWRPLVADDFRTAISNAEKASSIAKAEREMGEG